MHEGTAWLTERRKSGKPLPVNDPMSPGRRCHCHCRLVGCGCASQVVNSDIRIRIRLVWPSLGLEFVYATSQCRNDQCDRSRSLFVGLIKQGLESRSTDGVGLGAALTDAHRNQAWYRKDRSIDERGLFKFPDSIPRLMTANCGYGDSTALLVSIGRCCMLALSLDAAASIVNPRITASSNDRFDTGLLPDQQFETLIVFAVAAQYWLGSPVSGVAVDVKESVTTCDSDEIYHRVASCVLSRLRILGLLADAGRISMRMVATSRDGHSGT